MSGMNIENGSSIKDLSKPLSITLIMVCIYMFLYIERPWESIRYLQGIPIERFFAIATIIVAFLNGKLKVVSSPINRWVYGLLALHFLLAPFAFNPAYAVDQGIEYAKMVVLYMLMLAVADDEKKLKLLIKVFVFSMMFYMLHSLWEYYNGRVAWAMGISRMVGVDATSNDPNTFGGGVVLSLPFVYALLRSEAQSAYRKLYYVYFALAIICIVLTGSRSAFVAFVFLLILLGVAQTGRKRILFLFIALFSIAIIWTIMPEEKQERIRTLWDNNAGPENAHESAKGRLVGFEVSWKMFERKPFTGVGAGGKNFIGYRMENRIDDAGHESPSQAHNLYGEVLAEFGVFGAILFVGLVLTIYHYVFKVRSLLKSEMSMNYFPYLVSQAIIASLLLLLLLGLSGHNFYRPLWLWIAAWAGILVKITVKASSFSKSLRSVRPLGLARGAVIPPLGQRSSSLDFQCPGLRQLKVPPRQGAGHTSGVGDNAQ